MKITNTKLSNVERAFDAIPDKVREDKFSGSIMDGNGPLRPHSHLQGLAPYKDFFFLTQSDEDRKSGRLLVVDRTRDIKALVAEWTLPIVSSSSPYYWHAGGCQLVGDCLVVPVETGSASSAIQFFDVSDPMHVHELPPETRVPRDGTNGSDARDAGAVGVTTVNLNGRERVLLCVYDNGATDFYQSNGEDIAGGFSKLFSLNPPLQETEHQAVCLLTDTSEHVFAVFLNKSHTGKDIAVLYEVDLVNKKVLLIKERQFKTKSPLIFRAHFRWGASLEVVSASELAVYCTDHDYSSGCHIDGFDSLGQARRAARRKSAGPNKAQHRIKRGTK